VALRYDHPFGLVDSLSLSFAAPSPVLCNCWLHENDESYRFERERERESQQDQTLDEMNLSLFLLDVCMRDMVSLVVVRLPYQPKPHSLPLVVLSNA
jgi:hypothetical protein